jgi:hypothetical protein
VLPSADTSLADERRQETYRDVENTMTGNVAPASVRMRST